MMDDLCPKMICCTMIITYVMQQCEVVRCFGARSIIFRPCPDSPRLRLISHLPGPPWPLSSKGGSPGTFSACQASPSAINSHLGPLAHAPFPSYSRQTQ